MRNLLIAALLFLSFQLQAQSFEPGLWSTKESVQLNGLPLPSSSNKDCINESQAKDAKATIEKGLKNQGCSLTKWVVKNKKLDAAIKCKNDDIDAVGTLKGSFTVKSYDLTGEAKGKFRRLLPAVAELSLTGQWTQECPKP
jgi:hypothetical protein